MDLRDAWERNAADWVRWARKPGHDSYWRFHRQRFLDLVPPPGRLTLDVGCGEGRVTRDLKELGHRAVGVDASETMIAAAREADPSGEYLVADAAALPFSDGRADLAVAFMLLMDIDAGKMNGGRFWTANERSYGTPFVFGCRCGYGSSPGNWPYAA